MFIPVFFVQFYLLLLLLLLLLLTGLVFHCLVSVWMGLLDVHVAVIRAYNVCVRVSALLTADF